MAYRKKVPIFWATMFVYRRLATDAKPKVRGQGQTELVLSVQVYTRLTCSSGVCAVVESNLRS